MKIEITVVFEAEVPDGTDLDEIYVGLENENVGVMYTDRAGHGETRLGNVDSHHTISVDEVD